MIRRTPVIHSDLNGILDDVKGAEVVSVTHVAYQPKKVKVGQGGRVTLEDADFGLPEITGLSLCR